MITEDEGEGNNQLSHAAAIMDKTGTLQLLGIVNDEL